MQADSPMAIISPHFAASPRPAFDRPDAGSTTLSARRKPWDNLAHIAVYCENSAHLPRRRSEGLAPRPKNVEDSA
jgi:hypothetical protein